MWQLTDTRMGGLLWWLHPNGKTQVTLSCGHAGKTELREHALASSLACVDEATEGTPGGDHGLAGIQVSFAQTSASR